MPEAKHNFKEIVSRLLDGEHAENNHLIAILGNIRPTRSNSTPNASSLTSLVRGLCTKNTKLTQILASAMEDMDSVNEIELFKATVNEFILWLDQGGLTLFQRYCVFLAGMVPPYPEVENLGLSQLGKPLTNCRNYVVFMEAACNVLRNPFVLGKLQDSLKALRAVIADWETLLKLRSLNNIEFAATFDQEPVSSYFGVKQIAERTGEDPVLLSVDNQRSRIDVELVLLRLESGTNEPNALALMSVAKGVRTVLYPPFRVNELQMNWEGDSLVLRPIAFSSPSSPIQKMVLSSPQNGLLSDWHAKMVRIFPTDGGLVENKQTAVLSGLGINIVTERQERPIYESPVSAIIAPSNDSFRELITSPSLSCDSPLSQLQSHFDKRKNSSQTSVNEPARPFANSNSSSPAHSTRSMSIIQKTLTNGSIKSVGASIEVSIPPSIPVPGLPSLSSPATQVTKRSTQQSSHSVAHLTPGIGAMDMPQSSEAQISFVTPHDEATNDDIDVNEVIMEEENTQYESVYQKPTVTQSAPDLSKKSLYKLSSGSALDLNNFGRNHNPSFSIHNNMSDIIAPKKKKKKFFGFFKKNKYQSPCLPQSPDSSIERSYEEEEKERTSNEVSAGTKTPANTTPNFPISKKTPGTNTSSTGSTTSGSTQKSPGPFAMPTSTSVTFFKQHVQEEPELHIPQSLKDVINDDSTIDFYLSESGPRDLIVSQWKNKHGKWEMLTSAERVFVKISVNYELSKSWFLVFKEVYDEQEGEDIDVPVLIMDIDPNTTNIRHSGALDVQIKATNSCTEVPQTVMIRGKTSAITKDLSSTLANVLAMLKEYRFQEKIDDKESKTQISEVSNYSSASMMERNVSSTSTSLASMVDKKLALTTSSYSLNSSENYNAQTIANPNNSRDLILQGFPVRVQRKLPGCTPHLNELSSWKIIAMYLLDIYLLIDKATNKRFYHLVLESDSGETEFNWLIDENDRRQRVSTIGKAGLILSVDESNHYMVECKGRQELAFLYSILMENA